MAFGAETMQLKARALQEVPPKAPYRRKEDLATIWMPLVEDGSASEVVAGFFAPLVEIRVWRPMANFPVVVWIFYKVGNDHREFNGSLRTFQYVTQFHEV